MSARVTARQHHPYTGRSPGTLPGLLLQEGIELDRHTRRSTADRACETPKPPTAGGDHAANGLRADTERQRHFVGCQDIGVGAGFSQLDHRVQ